MWNSNELAAPMDTSFQPLAGVSTMLFDAGYEKNVSMPHVTEKLVDFGDLMIVDGSAAAPAGSGSVGELETALTKGIQSLQMLAESNSTTVRFDQAQQRVDGNNHCFKTEDQDGVHAVQIQTKMQYELRPDQNGVPRVQMVGEKLDIGSITYKMQDNADALVRVKYGDSHDLKGPLVQPGDKFWIFVPGRSGQEGFIYPAAKWGPFGPEGAGHDGAKFQEDMNYINSHLTKQTKAA